MKGAALQKIKLRSLNQTFIKERGLSFVSSESSAGDQAAAAMEPRELASNRAAGGERQSGGGSKQEMMAPKMEQQQTQEVDDGEMSRSRPKEEKLLPKRWQPEIIAEDGGGAANVCAARGRELMSPPHNRCEELVGMGCLREDVENPLPKDDVEGTTTEKSNADPRERVRNHPAEGERTATAG
ncbi:hypothetical protein SASPL_154401 [Salvia splendens]|uniref:Uncharacterized protein n=1 Tax=Salvia splendens TaxID=180675 RepID=A0A8X8W020_SALSN|nr:hypothetical protein SASPL_154401 [Salvia splendens]